MIFNINSTRGQTRFLYVRSTGNLLVLLKAIERIGVKSPNIALINMCARGRALPSGNSICIILFALLVSVRSLLLGQIEL